MNDHAVKQAPVNGFRVRLNKAKARQTDVDAALSRLENFYFTSDHAEMIKSQKDVKTRFHIISDKIEEHQSRNGKRDKMLDEVLFLLENARVNSNDAMQVKRRRRMHILSLFSGAILLLVIAVLMIVLEPPAWLKGPTLLYFNPHDGVTASDVLAIVMIGISTFMVFLGFAELKRR